MQFRSIPAVSRDTPRQIYKFALNALWIFRNTGPSQQRTQTKEAQMPSLLHYLNWSHLMDLVKPQIKRK
jgi:hypothetical protein